MEDEKRGSGETVHVQWLWRMKSVVCLGKGALFSGAGKSMLRVWKGGR